MKRFTISLRGLLPGILVPVIAAIAFRPASSEPFASRRHYDESFDSGYAAFMGPDVERFARSTGTNALRSLNSERGVVVFGSGSKSSKAWKNRRVALDRAAAQAGLQPLKCFSMGGGEWAVEMPQVVARLKIPAHDARLAALLEAAGVELIREWAGGVCLFSVQPGRDPGAASAELETSDLVDWAHPDFLRPARPRYTPVDPFFADQWYLSNTGQYGGVRGRDIRAVQAWDIDQGSDTVVIAVLDDGFQLNHPDLATQIYNNPGESGLVLSTNLLDDDGNGYVDDWRGWDFVNNTNAPNPVFTADRHGTASAGIIAAQTENGIGVAGILPGGLFLPLRMVSGGTLQDSDLLEAIFYAAKEADVISIGYFINPAPAVLAALRHAAANGRNGKGCVIVAALGNDGVYRRFDSDAAASPEVISVTGHSNYDRRAGLADYGEPVDIAAPGGGGSYRITTTDRTGTDGYESGDYAVNSFEGTSPACAILAGAAGLVLSIHPDWTGLEVRRALLASADKIDARAHPYDVRGRNHQYGYGRLNLLNALEFQQPASWDAYEPDASMHLAAVVTNGSFLFRSLSSTADVDWIRFELGTTSHLRVTIVGTTNGALALYGSSTNLLANDEGGVTGFSRIETNGLGAGTYFARITCRSPVAVSNYGLHFGLHNVIDGYEPDASTGTASVLPPRVMQFRTLYPSGDVDHAVFTLTNSAQVDVWTLGEWNGWLHSSLWKNGSQVASNYTESPLTHISTQVTAGTYYVRVRDNDGFAVSSYQLLLEIREQDAQEPNGGTNEATVVEPGVPVNGTLYPAGDIDWFRFTMTNSGALLVMTDTINPLLLQEERDTYLTVYDSDLNILGFDNNGNNGRCSAVFADQLSPGTYYAEVKGFLGTTVCPNYFIHVDTFSAESRMTQPSASHSGMLLRWQGDALFNYAVEFTSSVGNTGWTFATNIPGRLGTNTWLDDGSLPGPASFINTPARFYRVRASP